jgi:zinc protease
LSEENEFAENHYRIRRDLTIRRAMVSTRSAFFGAALALAASAHGNPRQFDLPNGLRLIVKEDHRAPTVVHQVWYRAGSMDEAPGTTGWRMCSST